MRNFIMVKYYKYRKEFVYKPALLCNRGQIM